MAAVFVLVVALFLILAIAVAVVIAGTAESRRAAQSVPGGRWMARQAERLAEQINPINAHSGFGLLSTPERDRRAERWFEKAESRVVAVLSRSPCGHRADRSAGGSANRLEDASTAGHNGHGGYPPA
jgi:hypothetical protein